MSEAISRRVRTARPVRRAAHVALALCAVLAVASRAGAEPPAAPTPSPGTVTSILTIDGVPGRRLTVDTPVHRRAGPHAVVSPIIYLERCIGGCTVRMGTNDARTNTSTVPKQSMSTVREFQSTAGATSPVSNDEWAQVVQCVQEVYSPYNVTVTDVKPTSGGYHESVIAGFPGDIGYGMDILGVAPLASDCSAIDNVMSFTFANQHPGVAGRALERVLNICWTAAQESAHAFGLDHEFEFVAGKRSACNDPMTYRNDCGGQKFFRNEAASCGETASRACKCGAQQNSHLKILSVFGAGTPTTGNPTITLTDPAMDGAALTQGVSAKAGSRRGIARVDLWFNGFKWAEVPGAQFGRQGQANPSDYTAVIPAALPNSIVDIKMIAYDDIGGSTESDVVTVTKGEPCATAGTCAAGQKCEEGKCFWDPPIGELGDTCAYPQFCKSTICRGTKDEQICTHDCIPGVADSCETGFECVMSSANTGVCFFTSSGGCCSVDRGDGAWWVHLGLGAAVLGFVVRRRRR